MKRRRAGGGLGALCLGFFATCFVACGRDTVWVGNEDGSGTAVAEPTPEVALPELRPPPPPVDDVIEPPGASPQPSPPQGTGEKPAPLPVVPITAGNGSGGSSSEADPPALPPRVYTSGPVEIARGQRLEILGEGFLPDAQVRIGERSLEPVAVTTNSVTVTVPYDLALDGCGQELPLTVTTSAGSSVPVAIVVRFGRPLVTSTIPDSLPAGEAMDVEGLNLGNLSVSLDGQALTGTDTFLVPEDLPPHSAMLTIGNGCESVSATLVVLRALPAIRGLSLREVAPGGVVYISTNQAARESLNGVELEGVTLDASHFQLSPSQIKARPVAESIGVRIPEGYAPGPTLLRLLGTDGASAPISLNILPLDTSPRPPTSTTIRFLPVALGYGDEGFPTGGFGNSRWTRQAGDSTHWWYLITANDVDESSAGACDGIGTVFGEEKYFEGDADIAMAMFDTATQRSEITGEVRLDGTENWLRIQIHRPSGIEEFAGGYTFDGPAADAVLNHLVLTSLSTGRQIDMENPTLELPSRNTSCWPPNGRE